MGTTWTVMSSAGSNIQPHTSMSPVAKALKDVYMMQSFVWIQQKNCLLQQLFGMYKNSHSVASWPKIIKKVGEKSETRRRGRERAYAKYMYKEGVDVARREGGECMSNGQQERTKYSNTTRPNCQRPYLSTYELLPVSGNNVVTRYVNIRLKKKLVKTCFMGNDCS